MKNYNAKKMFDKLEKKIKQAPVYDWFPYEQTSEGLKIRKLIEYAKVSEYKKEK